MQLPLRKNPEWRYGKYIAEPCHRFRPEGRGQHALRQPMSHERFCRTLGEPPFPEVERDPLAQDVERGKMTVARFADCLMLCVRPIQRPRYEILQNPAQ